MEHHRRGRRHGQLVVLRIGAAQDRALRVDLPAHRHHARKQQHLRRQQLHEHLARHAVHRRRQRLGQRLHVVAPEAAVDAAYGAANTWDFYKNTFGRNGIRNNGVAAYSRVHYGVNYENAFWDDSCFCMTYGDGGSTFNPLVSLDVAGHEMSHGVTSNTAGLIYSGESGGLNEATSDIFGTMVEFTANNASDPGDYYIGEEIAKERHLPASDGQPLPRRRLGQLLVVRCRQPRRALLVRRGQPLLLPVGRGLGREDDRWSRPQQPDLQRLDRHRHRQGRGSQDLVPRADDLHDVDDQVHRCSRRHASRPRVTCTARTRRSARCRLRVRTRSRSRPALSTCGGDATPPPSGNLLLNPGFESGNVNWIGSSGVIGTGTGYTPRTGSYNAWLTGTARRTLTRCRRP